MIVLPAALGWGAASAATLLVEHLLLYDRLSRVEAYAVGTATIGGALTGYAATVPQQSGADVAAAFWPIAIISGAAVAAAYAIRAEFARRDAAAFRAGQVARSLEGSGHAPNAPQQADHLDRRTAGARAGRPPTYRTGA